MCDRAGYVQHDIQILNGWRSISSCDADPSIAGWSFILSHEEAVLPDREDEGCLDHGSKLTD